MGYEGQLGQRKWVLFFERDKKRKNEHGRRYEVEGSLVLLSYCSEEGINVQMVLFYFK